MFIKNTSDEQKLPELAPPGAGIPFYDRLLLRFVVGPLVAGRAEWKQCELDFNKVNARILKEVDGLSSAQLSKRILVPPQRGLEDSSRYWSIAMVLEHLTIVNAAITGGIILLSRGSVPPGKVDIAAVKPIGAGEAKSALDDYKKSVEEEFKKFLNLIQNRESKLTYEHPWFGPFNCRQWFWLLATHSAVHLKQIREIKKRLPLF